MIPATPLQSAAFPALPYNARAYASSRSPTVAKKGEGIDSFAFVVSVHCRVSTISASHIKIHYAVESIFMPIKRTRIDYCLVTVAGMQSCYSVDFYQLPLMVSASPNVHGPHIPTSSTKTVAEPQLSHSPKHFPGSLEICCAIFSCSFINRSYSLSFIRYFLVGGLGVGDSFLA